MSVISLHNLLLESGYNKELVNKVEIKVKERWPNKDASEHFQKWLPFFKELYHNYGNVDDLILADKVISFYAIDTALVTESNPIKKRKTHQFNLTSGEKIILPKETIEDLESILDTQDLEKSEIPGFIPITKIHDKNYTLGRLRQLEVLRTKINESVEKNELIDNAHSVFTDLWYHNKSPKEETIRKHFEAALTKKSVNRFYSKVKESNLSLTDFLLKNANNYCIANQDAVFSNVNCERINKVPIHTHPEIKSEFQDNRFPSEEIVYLEDFDYFTIAKEKKEKLSFHLIVTPFKGDTWLTAYSIDQEKDYHINMFKIRK